MPDHLHEDTSVDLIADQEHQLFLVGRTKGFDVRVPEVGKHAFDLAVAKTKDSLKSGFELFRALEAFDHVNNALVMRFTCLFVVFIVKG